MSPFPPPSPPLSGTDGYLFHVWPKKATHNNTLLPSSPFPCYSGKLSLKNQRPKYQITHPKGKIAETDDVRLRLHYNVQPWVGALTWDQGRDYGFWKAMAGGESKVFALPATKKKDGEEATTAKGKSGKS